MHDGSGWGGVQDPGSDASKDPPAKDRTGYMVGDDYFGDSKRPGWAKGLQGLLGVGANLSGLTGFDFAAGFFGDILSDEAKPKCGGYVSLGPAGGIIASAEVFVGAIKEEALKGSVANVNISIGPISATIMMDPTTGKIVGGTLGCGWGFPIGASGSFTSTAAIPDETEPVPFSFW
jgi:hypothetical protein